MEHNKRSLARPRASGTVSTAQPKWDVYSIDRSIKWSSSSDLIKIVAATLVPEKLYTKRASHFSIDMHACAEFRSITFISRAEWIVL
jgi:hypothetical protein